MSRLELLVLFHPLLIVIVAGFTILVITGCVRVTHRLPPPMAGWTQTGELQLVKRCALVQKLKRQFGDEEIPAELTQAEEICREAGL